MAFHFQIFKTRTYFLCLGQWQPPRGGHLWMDEIKVQQATCNSRFSWSWNCHVLSWLFGGFGKCSKKFAYMWWPRTPKHFWRLEESVKDEPTWMLSYSWDGYGAAWRCNRWTWKSCQWDNWQFTWCRCCSHGRGQQWHQWKSFGRAASISISFYPNSDSESPTADVSGEPSEEPIPETARHLREINERRSRALRRIGRQLQDAYNTGTQEEIWELEAQQDWWTSVTWFLMQEAFNDNLQWCMMSEFHITMVDVSFTAGYIYWHYNFIFIMYRVFANMVWADAVKAKHRTVPWRWKVSPSVTNFSHGMDHRIW